MVMRWPGLLPSACVMAAMLVASPMAMAADSSVAAASLEGAEVVTSHLFNALLYLPSGLVAAALILEFFAQWKHNREVEPGILFLLFGAAAAAVGVAVLAYVFSPVGRENGQLTMFAMWMGVVAAAIAAAFYLKRQARNRRLFSLHPVPQLFGRVVVPRSGGERGLIIGYRLGIVIAFLLTLVGVSEMPLSQAHGPSLTKAVRAVSQSFSKPAATPAVTMSTTEPVGGVSPPAPAPAPVAAAPAPSLATLLANSSATTDSPRAAEADGSASGSAAASIAATTPDAGTPSAEPLTPPPEPQKMPTPTTAPSKPAGTAAAPPAPDGRASSAPKPATTAAGAKLPANFFATKIKPILEAKCVNCHGSSKQKGDLRLDSVAAIKQGAGHPVVVGGDLELSSLYQRLITPDGEDLMPPPDKGGPLPPNIIAMVKAWVLAGADFGDGNSAGVKAPAVAARAGGKLEEEKSKSLPPPPAELVSRLTEAGAVIRPMSANGALLDINLTHLEQGSINLAELAPLAKNVLALDLSRTRLKDDDLAPLASMTSLVRLDLKRNTITDSGLEHLKGLTELESLNLFDTQVTDAGLSHLVGLKKLQKIFLFNTQVTPAGAAQLRSAIPGVVVNLGE